MTLRSGQAGGEIGERRAAILAGGGEADEPRALRREPARLAGVGEERDRRLGPAEDDRVQPGEIRLRLLAEVRQAFDGHSPRAALEPGGKGLAHQPRTRCGGDAPGVGQRILPQCPAAEEEALGALSGERGGDVLDHGRGHARCDRRSRRIDRGRPFGPGMIGRDDHRRDSPAPRHRHCHRSRLRQVALGARGAHPVGHRPGHRRRVGGQRRVVMEVVGRVVADQVDDRRPRTPRVVEVGEPVAEPRPMMEQGHRGAIGHARVAVGGAGHDPLEQAEDRAHPVLPVDRGDQLHLRRAGIGETDLDAGLAQGLDKGFGSVHAGAPQ